MGKNNRPMDPEKDIVTPDEAQAEQEALAEAKDDEIRANVVSSLGLEDNEDNRDLINKLVEREKGHRTKLSGAIRQKKSWREKDTKPPATPAQHTETKPGAYDPEAARKQTEDTVKAQLEQRDLEEMDHSDEIKAEIKKLAQLQNVSVRRAEKDPYIQHLIAQAAAADGNLEAAVPHTPRSTAAPAQKGKVPSFNMATEEGRKAYREWKDGRKK